MLSPAGAGFVFRDVHTAGVAPFRCAQEFPCVTRPNADFYTIHTPYYDYYCFKSNR